MGVLPDPSPAEVMEALGLAITSSDRTVQELLRTLVIITRVVHARPEPVTFWTGLPEFGGR